MDKNKQLAELLGLPWHEEVPNYLPDYGCLCGYKSDRRWILKKHLLNNPNPDFTTPIGIYLLLREMAKRKDWDEFLINGGPHGTKVGFSGFGLLDDYINLIYILDTKGKLRDAVIEWLEKEKETEKLRAFWEWSRLADKMTFEQYEWKTTETTGGEAGAFI